MLKNMFATTTEFAFPPTAARRLLADPPKSPYTRQAPRRAVMGWKVRINGEAYPVKDWNEHGFLANDCLLDCKAGDRLDIEFSVPAAGGGFESNLHAVVVRVDSDSRELAGVFVTA
jgi:hypothetical protein